MQYLDEKLKQYSESDVYPFHMPGHKRQALDFPNPYRIDITEIDGFDNLHHAEDILKEAQERAAALYESEYCYYLVNGSTCGLLAAICAAMKKRDKVLVARNCHKAVYHALSLHELDAEYLYPAITANDLQGQITPEQVEKAFRENPAIAAVVITSPTYEGILSDVKAIAEVCHAYGAPLIVDSAHGAHLGFGGGFPESAVRLGADAVIMSLHKTLPSFTQTALLHLNGTRIVPEQVERYLGMFETSSPSYLFMAGMDACVRMVKEDGARLFGDYRKMLDEFYRQTADLKHLHVMRREDLSPEEAFAWDDSKLVIFLHHPYSREQLPVMTGKALYRMLRERFQLQMEMTSGNYVLGMTSILDTREGFERLAKALHELDRELENGGMQQENAVVQLENGGMQQKNAVARAGTVPEDKYSSGTGFTARVYTQNRREMQIYQAVGLPYEEVSFAEAEGKMSADYVFLYPPGIPLIVPGEVISREFLENIRECRRRGLSVEGQRNLSLERIKIVYF